MRGVEYVDLRRSIQNSFELKTDICVIGAGAAGIYLAVQLALKGTDVALVEAGSIHCSDASAIGFDAKFEDCTYPGATQGRFFGIGGTTSRWGGQLIPHTEHDVRNRPMEVSNAWTQIVNTVNARADGVLRKLGWKVENGIQAFGQRDIKGVSKQFMAAGYDVTQSLYMPFRRKNLTKMLKSESYKLSRVKVIYNAVAKSWITETDNSSDTRFERLLAISDSGKQVTISARQFIIAAGTIESTRLLLELNDSAEQTILHPGCAVGCFLSDHLSLAIADVAPSERPETIKLFAPHFDKGWMRANRFVESNPPPELPRAFAHFIFENRNPGFAVAKQVLTAVQSRRWPALSASTIFSGTSGLFSLAYKRYLHSTLHIPVDSPVHLQLDIEQDGVRENKITIGSEKDRYGRKEALIDWRISDQDLINMRQIAVRILSKWPGGKAGIPNLLSKTLDKSTLKPFDAYHPVGTCRMGDNEDSVVDMNLKVIGTNNLWLVSTGVLPSAGTANPTFTMLCLADALVDHITKCTDNR